MRIVAALGLCFVLQSLSELADQVRSLVAQLGSNRVEVRQEAEDSLVRLGEAVLSQLEEWPAEKDQQIKARIKSVILRIRPPFHILASVPDLADLASEVGGDQVSTAVLVGGKDDGHFLDAKPSLVKRFTVADLYIKVGMEFEIGYEPPLLDRSGNAKIRSGQPRNIDASEGLKPLEVPTTLSGSLHPYGNPHYLADPIQGLRAARLIRDCLSKLRPSKKAYFEGRYRAFREQIAVRLLGKDLSEKYSDRFEELSARESCAGGDQPDLLAEVLSKDGQEKSLGGWLGALSKYRGTKVVADHNAWPYFARRFGIDVVGSFERFPGAAPEQPLMDRLMKRMKDEGVKLVLTSSFFDRNYAPIVARATGAKVVDMAHQVGSRSNADTYIQMVDYNVRQIVAALEGGR